MSGTRGKEIPGGQGEIVVGGVKPISPKDVTGERAKQIPDSVLGAFNALIAQNFRNGSACVLQDDVVARLEERGLNRREIFDKGWLDVEDLYRNAGWYVQYDKPGFSESYPATFTFIDPQGKGIIL